MLNLIINKKKNGVYKGMGKFCFINYGSLFWISNYCFCFKFIIYVYSHGLLLNILTQKD